MENKIIHRIFLSIFMILGLVSYVLIQNKIINDDLNLLLFCFFLILILGVSHGALDHLRGKKIFKPVFQKSWFLLFYPGYISLSLVVILCWILFPAITLLLFLFIASYHFGEEDLRFFLNGNGFIFNMLSFLKGFLIITLSFHYSFDSTSMFFEYLLVPQEFYKNIVQYKSLFFSMNLILLVIGLIFLLKNQLDKLVLILLEILLIVLSFIYLPLILAFSLYFCFLHSSKHMIGLSRELDPKNIMNGLKLFSIKAIPLTLLTAIIAIVVVYYLDQNLSKNIVQTIFIGLASLTLPHILLEILNRKK